MGFNKRTLNQNSLTQVFKARGIEGVTIYVTKPDAIFCEDVFSSKVVKLLDEGNTEELIKLFSNE
jgi:hypothetical protein